MGVEKRILPVVGMLALGLLAGAFRAFVMRAGAEGETAAGSFANLIRGDIGGGGVSPSWSIELI